MSGMNATQLFRAGADRSLSHCVAALARSASIEINVQDLKYLEESGALLPAGKKLYVSHLPKQRWEDTIAACRTVRKAGFEPVPHIPVRLLADASAFDRLLGELVSEAQVREALLISGDYPRAAGPYASVLDALRTNLLQQHGFSRVSLAGHPEGHPRVSLEEIRQAQIDKAIFARDAGLATTFVTQFCFDAAPFIQWASELANAGVNARFVAGVAGPAKLTTLVNFALRCGVGPSIRALSARPGVLNLLMSEHRPDDIIEALASATLAAESSINGLHIFCFGGFLRTCKWLRSIEN